MYRYLLILVLCLMSTFSFGQSPTLNVVIPGNSRVNTSSATYRYGGHTEVGNTVTVNGVETKVYPTGAFVGLLSLNTGSNVFQFVAKNSMGQTKSYDLTINRTPPPEQVPETEIKLSPEGMLPSVDQTLIAGDILPLKVKGTPGTKVTAAISGLTGTIEMQELPPDQTNGLKGIYSGVYRVQPSDNVFSSYVNYQLEKSGSPIVNISSKAKVNMDSKTWPRVGMILSDNAFLSVGLGEARLGGTQYGYLPISTKLVLDGMSGNQEDGSQYHVRLSPTLHAYIPKRFVKESPEGTHFPTTYVGQPTLESKGKYDVVSLDTRERLPFIIQEIMDPPGLRVHIYGATSNLTWITSKLSLKNIKDITWTQVADNDLQIDLALKEPPVWGYDAIYSNGGNGLEIRIKHKPEISKSMSNPLQGLTIAVDAGHGGSNSGAVGALGILEKLCTLAMANDLKAILESKGVKVVMTRIPETENVPMSKRIERVVEGDADVLVSIHCNSIGDTTDPLKTRGTTMFYKFPINRKLAGDILNRLIQVPGLPENGEVSSFNFALGKVTGIPSVLAEVAYLSHPDEEAIVVSDSGRQAIAQAIADGLSDYFASQR